MVFIVASVSVPKLLMQIFTSAPGLIDQGAEYLRYVCISWMFYGISQICQCVMRNSGRAMQSSLISSVSVLFKILLNCFFLLGWFGMPKLGIFGVALATVLYRGAELLWTLIDLCWKCPVKIRVRTLFLGGWEEITFFRYLCPVLSGSLIWGGGILTYSVILGHLGEDAVAANSLADSTRNFAVCVILGIQYASSILVGQELGAGNLRRAREYGNKIVVTALVCGSICALLLALSVSFIPRIVELTPKAREYLQWMLVISALSMIGKSGNGPINEIFVVGGEPQYPVKCAAVAMWGVVIPLGALAAFVWHWSVPVVFFILYLEEVIKLPVTLSHFKKYCWVKNLTVERINNEISKEDV